MADGNWLMLGGGAGGMSYKVKVLELVSTPTLENGVVIWAGRLAVPTTLTHLNLGVHGLTLEDKRSGEVLVIEVNDKEATFMGRLS